MSRIQLDLFKLAEEVEQVEDKKLIGDDDLQHQLDNEGKIRMEETEWQHLINILSIWR